MLRVLIDATAIPADRGGVGRYLDGLIPALVTGGETAVTVACQDRDAAGFAAAGAEVRPVPARLNSRPARLAWEQAGLPRLAVRTGADVLHCPHYTMPVRSPVPVAVTVHDATFFSDPGVHTAVKGRFFRSATRLALRRAAAVIVPSLATRAELCRLVSARAARAVVAHHGVDSAVFAPPTDSQLAELRALTGLGPDRFIAFLGTIEPRKNVAALVRACQQLDDPPVLVLAGGPGWDGEIDGVLAGVRPPLRVLRPGYLPLPLLPALLAGAELVCYPALGEGFGLPVLEAMACGAATVTTRRLALPEVGGDAVEYCPVDAAGMAVVLARLLADEHRRAELRRLGVARAAAFSWQASAQHHARGYALAVRGR